MLDRICPELILMIYELLPSISDIMNLRLVSRILGEIGFRQLFRVIHINPNFTNLSNFALRKISQVPRFAWMVEKVIMDIKHPQDIIDYISPEKLATQSSISPENYTLMRAKARNENEQLWISSICKKTCAIVLTECFSTLPNLKAIGICQECITRFGCPNEEDFRPKAEAIYKLCAIMIAASCIKRKLVSFETNIFIDVNHQHWLPYTPGLARSSFKDVFENIQIMHLEPIRGGGYFETDILKMAKNLLHLRIKFTHLVNCKPEDDYFHIDSLISTSNIWPDLTILTLENIALSDHEHLLDLLRRHQSTLRVFTLKDCEYNSRFLPKIKLGRTLESWENLITEIKGILFNCQINIINPSYYGHECFSTGNWRDKPCSRWCPQYLFKAHRLPSTYTCSSA